MVGLALPPDATDNERTTGSIAGPHDRELTQAAGGPGPLGNVGEPLVQAHAALYLASDAARSMTGNVLRPNGGLFMPR